ncbi:MAG: DUF3109 family protein [Prevotella sp.]|nr:DUF3109 family protein [Prevotella sp.]
MSYKSEHPAVLPILQVGDVLLSPDILTEKFCCDYSKCKGICCVEGNAGAPVTMEEVGEIEEVVDVVWGDLSPQAQAVIDHQGVAYTDEEGDLVTSIVAGKDCVFTCHENGNCLCALEKACRAGKTKFLKPISCALYPIRAKQFSNGTVGLNYNRWEICRDAITLGERLKMPVYRFLKEPLIRRFGKEWYDELVALAQELAHVL